MKLKQSFYLLVILPLLLFSCQNAQDEQVNEVEEESAATASAFEDAPSWAKEVVWYQIFVERFRNGDKSNDPRPQDIEGSFPGFVPEGWAITPWTQDWYKEDPYFAAMKGTKMPEGYTLDKFEQFLQARRYGGDLQGVLDKVDYLDSLGVTAIYFNPLNDSPSLHKYDPRTWRHVDINFGPSPDKDIATMAQETPDDPSTWQMTGADQLFVDVIKAFHDKGIKVILDYSWNHTGNTFWALKDVQEKGEASKYKDWYIVEEYDDPSTEENEFDYKGWVGIKTLPEIKETVEFHADALAAYEGDFVSEAAKQHVFNITKRWLDPNGDGNPEDGVDGFRLDVAAEVGLEFWRDYRQVVREVNPEAYLVGEIWWEQWPDKLLDPEPFTGGDVFDAVMNYRWYRATRHFFNKSPNEISVTEYVDSLKRFQSNLRSTTNYAMMNLNGSHDTPRFGTSILNKNAYKYLPKPEDDSSYKLHKPDAATYNIMQLMIAQQFTYIGAPHIWNGDEMGMWGADDPSCRKPLIWPDYEFEDEVLHPLGLEKPTNQVKFDNDVFDYYRKMIAMRKANPVLIDGEIEYLTIDDENKVLAYSRYNDNDEVIAVFNASDSSKEIVVPMKKSASYEDVLNNNGTIKTEGGQISLTLEGRTAAVLVAK